MTTMDASAREQLENELADLVANIYAKDGSAFAIAATRIGAICTELGYPCDRLPGSLGRYQTTED